MKARADEATQRILSAIKQNKAENERYERRKLYEELFDDLPILLFCVIIPGILIGVSVDILHGAAYGIVFLTGYGIGKSRKEGR